MVDALRLSTRGYIRVDAMTGIDDIDGNASIAPDSNADIRWLIIPGANSGGRNN